jgi:predicted small secreted protein
VKAGWEFIFAALSPKQLLAANLDMMLCAHNRICLMKISIAFAVAAALLIPLSAKSAHAYSGENYGRDAKITIRQASEIAFKARPGKIAHRELEREKGGSDLRYSFDITSHKIKYEVGVDAQTGTVLENARARTHPD